MQITQSVFKGCIKNDRKAQKVLFEAFKARILGLCRRYAASTEEAEDVFQEAFIKIFNNIRDVREYCYLERWIIKTTINTAINYYHKNKRHHDHLNTEDIEEFDDDDSSVIDNLSNDNLVELINELPSGYRLVFNLYVIEGYKHGEIGEMLGISENTSKSQLSRAKGALKAKLKALGIEKFEKYG